MNTGCSLTDSISWIKFWTEPDMFWYFITTRPLAAFNFLGNFGAYRDMQAAFSAMALVDPLIQRAKANNSL